MSSSDSGSVICDIHINFAFQKNVFFLRLSQLEQTLLRGENFRHSSRSYTNTKAKTTLDFLILPQNGIAPEAFKGPW